MNGLQGQTNPTGSGNPNSAAPGYDPFGLFVQQPSAEYPKVKPSDDPSNRVFFKFGEEDLQNMYLNPLYEAMLRRENLQDEGEALLRAGVAGQATGGGAQALDSLLGSYNTDPYLASSPELEKGMIDEARRRIGQAQQGAATQIADLTGMSGTRGGESASAQAGTQFRASSELASAINTIKQEMALRRAQERAQNVSTVGRGLNARLSGVLDPIGQLATSVAGRTNPELNQFIQSLMTRAGYELNLSNQPGKGWERAIGVLNAIGSIIPG